MAEREFTIQPGSSYSACPKCQSSKFVARSAQVAEDGCEIWVACAGCGHDPTADNSLHRVESVMGGLDRESIITAMDVREDLLGSGRP